VFIISFLYSLWTLLCW
jgi:hypothetical protein